MDNRTIRPHLLKLTHLPWNNIPRTQNPDGTVSYTFTPEQVKTLFNALSHYTNLVETVPGQEIDATEKKKVRSLREQF